jgi:hypothetical protein
MELRIEIEGEVVEREELLNGTQVLTIEGRSGDGWTLSGGLSWNVGLSERGGEGDITVSRQDGAEVYGSLSRLEASESGGEGEELRLRYEIDGGAGEFEAASGTAEAEVSVTGTTFRGVWRLPLKFQ